MPCSGTCSDLAFSNPFASSYVKPHYLPRVLLRPTHLDLDLHFQISDRTLKATVTHTLVTQVPGAHVIVLNAEDFDQVHVSSPDDDMLSFTYDGHSIQAIFSFPLVTDHKVSLVIAYQIVDPIDGLLFSGENEGHWAASDHETERARYWLPVIDHPSVRTTLSFKLRTPAKDNLTALANGKLISEKIEADTKVTYWKMEQITPSYLICVAVGNFLVADGGDHNGKPIKFFAPKAGRHPYTQEDLALTFGRTKEMISFMESKVRFDLPWPKYYQFCACNIGGAMENSSLVSYDDWYMLDGRSALEKAHRVDSTIVHELAHTWFGDTVVCSDFCHSFLKESFATLISAEWYNYKNGKDEFQHTLTRYAEVSFEEAAEYVRPIVCRKYESSWSLFDRHLYTNGAWRLHMLRNKIGDQRFWNAVSHYLHKRAWKTVEADDFRRDLEESTNEQLCSFFDQWFYGRGHPVLEVSFSYDASKCNYASVSIKQVQVDGVRGIGLFDITIDIAMEVSSGHWDTFTLTMEDGADTAQIVHRVPGRPLQVVVDPEKKVLFDLVKLGGVGDDMNIRSLAHAPTFTGRYTAARLLFQSGTRKAREALRDALKSDVHWGIRVAIAKWLGKATRKESLPTLIDAAFADSDARVVPTILMAIGEYNEPEAEEALLKFVQKGTEEMRPYGAMGAALRGIGKTRKIEHLEFLTKYLEEFPLGGKSFEIPFAAASALGCLRDWKAVEVLMRNSFPPNAMLPTRVRCELLRGIGNAVCLEKYANRVRAYEFVERVCKSDEHKMVLLTAGSVLAGLADVKNPISTLHALEKRVGNHSKPRVRKQRELARKCMESRGVGSMARAAGVEKIQKELSDLRSKLEELQAKFDVKEIGKDCKQTSSQADGKK